MKNIPPMKKHQQHMQKAFLLAEQAYEEKEIPVGAIIVKQDRIIGKGYNQTERLKDATAHAEMLAISAACSTLDNKYLEGCTLYVTLEPCPMCAGALVWSKIDRIVFGATDSKSGACGSLFNLAANNKLNHQVEVIQGIMEQDCEWLLKQFFQEQRSDNNGSDI
ncbi:nucleoside deaminase [Balneolaceae bacterium YR4-1]|uniref:tRNA-specific adenosine deaminase n=2 Tax=Halalkalibaculum roseum TaxID=2709311 RepID=A0A6M1SWC3_9BACT|nr:tRNA adenosine(34) deaminase TadA [Halalkalibaculum roseum]NGP76386.1 nucleoside deaminase [Halalkalibaculum roseum]